MQEWEVRSPEKALAYIVDCTMATVEDMAMKKSRKKHEYSRQISIAQKGVNWMRSFGISPEGTRVEKITTTVQDWAKQYEPPC